MVLYLSFRSRGSKLVWKGFLRVPQQRCLYSFRSYSTALANIYYYYQPDRCQNIDSKCLSSLSERPTDFILGSVKRDGEPVDMTTELKDHSVAFGVWMTYLYTFTTIRKVIQKKKIVGGKKSGLSSDIRHRKQRLIEQVDRD